jgi:hypothetical protein
MFISGPGCNVSVPFAFGAEAADADGPVADTAEPVAAEAGRTIPEPDRDDTHTMGHE